MIVRSDQWTGSKDLQDFARRTRTTDVRHQVSDLGNEGHGLVVGSTRDEGIETASREAAQLPSPSVLPTTFRHAYEPPAGEIG